MYSENLPFALPFELCEEIFGYLSVNDLLKCCLVSKSWLDFINESKIASKILILIDDETKANSFCESTRRFFKLKLNKLNGSTLIKILTHIQLVTELEVENCELNDVQSDMIFSCLKCLSISNCCGDIISKIFKNPCKSLKCLVLHQLYGPSSRHVLHFLKSNPTLEEANFYLDETNNMFTQDISTEVRFKLKSLFISYKCNYDLPLTTLTNIENFLKAQGDTLETISLINSANLELLLRTWNFLKAVERLYFFSSDPYLGHLSAVVHELKKNLTLVDLELHALGPNPIKVCELVPFLDNARNLKSFGVWKLEAELVEYIARNIQSVRAISCASMDSNCLTTYNNLKSIIGINDKINIHQYL